MGERQSRRQARSTVAFSPLWLYWWLLDEAITQETLWWTPTRYFPSLCNFACWEGTIVLNEVATWVNRKNYCWQGCFFIFLLWCMENWTSELNGWRVDQGQSWSLFHHSAHIWCWNCWLSNLLPSSVYSSHENDDSMTGQPKFFSAWEERSRGKVREKVKISHVSSFQGKKKKKDNTVQALVSIS